MVVGSSGADDDGREQTFGCVGVLFDKLAFSIFY